MTPHVIHLIFVDITAFVYKSAKTEALCGPYYSPLNRCLYPSRFFFWKLFQT